MSDALTLEAQGEAARLAREVRALCTAKARDWQAIRERTAHLYALAPRLSPETRRTVFDHVFDSGVQAGVRLGVATPQPFFPATRSAALFHPETATKTTKP